MCMYKHAKKKTFSYQIIPAAARLGSSYCLPLSIFVWWCGEGEKM